MDDFVREYFKRRKQGQTPRQACMWAVSFEAYETWLNNYWDGTS